ncbi:hypothetical protein [uncultured Limosilactobacillus sp.]|uniref:hypothetical protein n=1 Tax=uncultured Limosilactobacillus sp. TaxID=2837629 RepID=UPI0025EA63B7|nr:hypothetical protein [uncultured Limosilactobacillus sp.]
MKFIQYNLTGKVVEQYLTDVKHLKANPVAEKVRITMNSGKKYVGFWDTFIENHKLPDKIKVSRYDLDEETGKLRSNKDIADYVPVKRITKIEAILYSNPRWGTRATNKFVFAKPVKFDSDKDPFFKNWSKKNTQQNS